MSMTSNANDLSAQIRQRIEAQDRKLDEIDERKLQEYGERWDAIVNDKLPIIDAAMEKVNWRILDKLRRTEAETEKGLGRMHRLLLRAWLRPLVTGLVVGLGLLLSIFGGSWGLMQWQSSRVQRLLETQETYRRGIAQEQRALDQLQAQTWGVWLHEDADRARYVVLPRGTLNEEWPVTVLGQPAIRLSSE